MMDPASVLDAGFQYVADQIGFPVDQVRYVLLLFLCYPIALVFRSLLHPSNTSVTVRHAFSASVGITMGFICFGWQMMYLFLMVGVSYALLWVFPPKVVQRYTMVWAMGCMSVAHTYRLMSDFGGWHLDFTGPLMILVQKVTLVAFAFHDGHARKESELNDDQRKQKIDVQPSMLEYISYTFNFHSFLAGPSCTIQEFLSFMDGSNMRPLDNPNAFANAKEHSREPSPFYPAVSKLFFSLISLVFFVILASFVNAEMTIEPGYPFLHRYVLIWFTSLKIRCRYYFIFLLNDSISNACGFGFSGYDKSGHPQWDIVTNIIIWDVEFGLNFRSIANGWNVTTSKWLRRVCYERATFSPNMVTFALSALWHGFYPGYYFCLIFCAIGNEAARKMRRLVRPYFQTSLLLKRIYDIITHTVTHFWLSFGVIPFLLLWTDKALLYWSYYYYIPVVLSCIVLFLFPSGKKPKELTEKIDKHPKSTPTENSIIQPPSKDTKLD